MNQADNTARVHLQVVDMHGARSNGKGWYQTIYIAKGSNIDRA